MCIKFIFCDHNTKNPRNNEKLDEKDQNTWIWTTVLNKQYQNYNYNKNKQWKLRWILKPMEYVQSYKDKFITLNSSLKKSNSNENTLDIQTKLLAYLIISLGKFK